MCMTKSSSQNALLLECPWPLSRPVALKQLHISGCTTPSPFLFYLQQYCPLKVVDRHRTGESPGASVVCPVCPRCFFQLSNWMMMRSTLRSGENKHLLEIAAGFLALCQRGGCLLPCLMIDPSLTFCIETVVLHSCRWHLNSQPIRHTYFHLI